MARFGTTLFPRIRIGVGAGRYIYLPVLTTTQRDALTASAGYLVYNSTTTQVEAYNGSSWVAVGKLYGDATFLPLAGGALTGDVTMTALKTIDTMDPSVHLADLAAHTDEYMRLLRTGEYHTGDIARLNTGASALTANRLRAVPFMVVRDMTVDRIAIMVSSLADPSNIRLGIYRNGTNLYPGALLKDAGVVSGATTGVKAVTISQALTKGLYWLVELADAAPTCVYSTPNFSPLGILGTDFGYPNVSWDVAQAYGALPDPFTAGGSALYYEHFTLALRLLTLD